tara:strand:+ start:1248 stop:1388 length:141 start_codon:yes stop_codon:yes gene_type:complete
MFRICDSETGTIIYQTKNIHDLADYLYNTNPKYIKVNVKKEYIKNG